MSQNSYSLTPHLGGYPKEDVSVNNEERDLFHYLLVAIICKETD